MTNFSQPLLSVNGISKQFGKTIACDDISFDLWPGEVLGIVGESGSGKTTLLRSIAGLIEPDAGNVSYRTETDQGNQLVAVDQLDEPALRHLQRTQWAFVHQHPRDGLRMNVSAGANIGERLMATNWRHYGKIRDEAIRWLEAVEIHASRIDDLPRTFSGGDLIRGLVRDLGLSAIIVTHDLAVARLLSTRLMVMRHGEVIEHGLTDQVLEDPQAAYTQLLVSSVLQV